MRHTIITCAVVLWSASSWAGEVPTAEPSPEAVGLTLKLPWAEPSGTGLGIAYDNGRFGDTWAQGLRLQLPFLEHVAAVVRVLSLIHTTVGQEAYDLGGRLELVGRSAVLLNLVRLYGGGGVQVFKQLSGPNRGETTIGGGGQFGFEFFYSRRASFFLEVGGNGGGSSGSAGATIMAGVQVYPL